MKILILAAGMGERLGRLTSDRPKALVQVAGKPLIDHVLNFLDHPAVDEIGIVGGYKFDALESYFKNPPNPPLIKGGKGGFNLFHNPHFTEGSVRTIMTAADFLDADFLLMNVDHIYPKKMLDAILTIVSPPPLPSPSRGEGKGGGEIVACCDFDRQLGADDMKVKILNGDLIKIRKDLKDFDGGYIGMTYIPKEKLADYKAALKESYEVCGPTSNAETVLGHMAANGHKITIADLSGFGWLEVDTEEDLRKAEASA